MRFLIVSLLIVFCSCSSMYQSKYTDPIPQGIQGRSLIEIEAMIVETPDGDFLEMRTKGISIECNSNVWISSIEDEDGVVDPHYISLLEDPC